MSIGNGNGSNRLTNWLLGILAATMIAAIAQLWDMSKGVSKMTGTMEEWRSVLEEVKDTVRDLEREMNKHERLPEHEGARRRFERLEELHRQPNPHWGGTGGR